MPPPFFSCSGTKQNRTQNVCQSIHPHLDIGLDWNGQNTICLQKNYYIVFKIAFCLYKPNKTIKTLPRRRKTRQLENWTLLLFSNFGNFGINISQGGYT